MTLPCKPILSEGKSPEDFVSPYLMLPVRTIEEAARDIAQRRRAS